MTRFAAPAAVLTATVLWISPAQTTSTEPPLAQPSLLQAADVAWARGDYVTALTTYQQILDSPEAERSLEPIALQTGELFRTTELTTDGAAPQFSPDGRYLTYETGPPAARVVRLLPADGSTDPLAELPGSGAVFSQDGRKLAYLRREPSTASDGDAPSPAGTVQVETQPRTGSAFARAGVESRITIRELATGRETVVDTGSLRKTALAFAAGDVLLFGGSEGDGPQQIYRAAPGQAPAAVTSTAGDKTPALVNATGDTLLYAVRTTSGGRGAGPGRGLAYGLLDISTGRATPLDAADRPSFSADGRSIAYVARTGDEYRLMAGSVGDPAAAATVRHGIERMEAPSLSRDGSRIAYELMPNDDWEIYVSARDGSATARVTREIQHDLMPQFLGPDRLLAVIGEARHRRSYLYDLATGQRTRLFHNNTVRTIAPEYSWTPSPDGTKLLIVAERDGNTVSPERGVYLMDLTRKVSREDVRARVAANLASERALRADAQSMYAPIASDVRGVVADASIARVYGYEKALFDFDSKHITQPGNRLASAYLFDTYKSFGYTPELQWFDQRTALGGRTANVVARLEGTVNPELVYVVSSHYDSVAVGPGADDDSSGTAALLETARILAGHPQPATIVFASFTGEEAGLLGSREFVRQAVANHVHVVGALNNDMIGWANDFRLDDTIRYSNPGIRDVQHSAALQFTNLITYDALYYKNTDAAAYYEAYGDIVGGIGSYPVLGNPHYHQPHDLLETINHQLVTEVAKTTAATLMLLASSPSRITGLAVDNWSGRTATLSWTPSFERGISGYLVEYGPAANPGARQTTVTKPGVTLHDVEPGTIVAVKAINARALKGWDWARITLPAKKP